MTSTRIQRAARILPIVVLSLALGRPVHAEGLQPGLWKVTSAAEVRGAPAPPQIKTRCLTPEETSDLDKTFSPEHRAQNAACERTEHEMSGTRLRWRLKCTGQMSMDVTGTFDFDTPQHYTARVETKASIGGQTMDSRVNIEGERIGECP
jgi:Protein of unknown function (DUF3617)